MRAGRKVNLRSLFQHNTAPAFNIKYDSDLTPNAPASRISIGNLSGTLHLPANAYFEEEIELEIARSANGRQFLARSCRIFSGRRVA